MGLNLKKLSCFWCDYPATKIGTEEEGFYCTYDPKNVVPCSMKEDCDRYCNESDIPEYIRLLFSQVKELEDIVNNSYRLP